MTVVTFVTAVTVTMMDCTRLAERGWLVVAVLVVSVGTEMGRRWTLAWPLRLLLVDGPCLFAPPLRNRWRVQTKALDDDAGKRRMPEPGRKSADSAVPGCRGQLPGSGKIVVFIALPVSWRVSGTPLPSRTKSVPI